MNLKLFSLISSDDIPATKLQIKISGSLNAFTDDDVSFKRFSSLKEMFPSLGKALADSELIVIAVDPKIYVRTKTLLTKALSLDIEENPTVKKALGRAAEIPESQKLLQSQMPKGAVPFLTRDGVNSGFVISKGHQQIMYLPLDDARLDTVLRNGVIPYLTSGETIAVREEAYAPKNATVKPSVPPKRQEAPAPEKAAQTPPALPESVGEITSKTVNILRESGSRVAVNGNQNSEYVKSFGSVSPDFFEFFTFTPHVEDKGDFNVTDYTAQMAKSAKELASADFGACISDICNTDGCSYICIAVAGESSAIVRKLYREPDEKDESFIRDAAEELIELIGEKASGESRHRDFRRSRSRARSRKNSRQREKSPCFNTCNNSCSCRCGRHIFPCEISKRQKSRRGARKHRARNDFRGNDRSPGNIQGYGSALCFYAQ